MRSAAGATNRQAGNISSAAQLSGRVEPRRTNLSAQDLCFSLTNFVGGNLQSKEWFALWAEVDVVEPRLADFWLGSSAFRIAGERDAKRGMIGAGIAIPATRWDFAWLIAEIEASVNCFVVVDERTAVLVELAVGVVA